MKHFLTLFASLLVCLYTIAALRTPEEAMRIAASLGQDNHAARIPARQPQDLTHCYTALQSNGDPALYVFNRGEDEGFVLTLRACGSVITVSRSVVSLPNRLIR